MGTLNNKVGYSFLAAFMAFLVVITAILQPVSYADTKVNAFRDSDYSDEYGAFLSKLGENESGNDYGTVSYDGLFLGRWQIGFLGLQEVGFLDSSNNWTSLAASFGITSKETFLTSEAGQDYAVLTYHKKILSYAENLGITSYINTNVSGVVMSFSGMIAAAHAIGVGGLLSLIKNGTTGDSGNDAVGLKYMNICNGFNIESTVRNGSPSTGTAETTTSTTTTTTTTTETAYSNTTESSSTTETTTTTVTAFTTGSSQTSELKPPAYIIVTPSVNIATVGDWVRISIESDNAEEYYILMISPRSTAYEYKISGSSISLRLMEEGIYTIDVTGYNKAGESYAETLYVAAKNKTVVSEQHIGDVNNDSTVNISDVTLILRYYAYSIAGLPMDKNETFIKNYADVNDDGKIDISDADFILKYYAMNTAGMNVSWKEVLMS